MAKKRVYELAKDLGLSNKEMVDWLRAHEYDVKSHSSSLEDDQALAVVEKFRGEKPARAEAPKPSGSGVVLRRKKADTAAEHEHAAALAAQQAAVAVEPPARSVEVRKAEPPPAPVPERKAEPQPAAAEVLPPAIPAPRTPPPVPPPPPRPHVRPPPPKASGPIVQGPGGVQSVQVTENLTSRPTATRAVVLSRPLIPIARPAPRGPGAGGFRPRPVGEVRELAVVSGGPGRGREFIDVTKDNKGGPGQRGKKGPRVEKTETLSKQDLIDLARQRAYVPVRGHKKKSAKKGKTTEITEMAEHKKVIRIDETITVAELSQRMGVKGSELIKKLMAAGKMMT